jgi:hypothetical protein
LIPTQAELKEKGGKDSGGQAGEEKQEKGCRLKAAQKSGGRNIGNQKKRKGEGE